jgi:D-alanine-D-alanine ligase-like ATP-grasp enzyme
MYKPKGGINATLLPLDQLPSSVSVECKKAVDVMNRQIASVDCIYDELSDTTYVLEVNYNPQLVTIETFKDVRVNAFIDNLENIK